MAPKESQANKEITLVRGADGALYLINKTRTHLQLKEDKAHQVTEILKDAEKKLTEIIREDEWFKSLSCTGNVHVVVPEVFP
jgi:hypothetical protein